MALILLFFSLQSLANYEQQMARCENMIKQVENFQLDKDYKDYETGAPIYKLEEKCIQTCSVVNAKSNTWEAAQFADKAKKCYKIGHMYKCGNISACRTAVMDVQVRCRADDKPDYCNSNINSTCMSACTPPPGNNCIREDKLTLQQGRKLCSAPSAKPLISDAQATQIIRNREADMMPESAYQGKPPTSEAAKQSVFYGSVPTGDVEPIPSEVKPMEKAEELGAKREEAQQQQVAGQQNNPQNPGAGTQAASAPGGAPGGGSGGGGSAPSGFSGTGFGDGPSGSNETMSSGGFQGTSSSNSRNGELAGGLDPSMTSGEMGLGSPGRNMGPSSFSNRGGNMGAGGSSGGMFAGYSGKASPTSNSAGSLRTASTNGSPSLDSSGFNSGFHKFNGSGGGGTRGKKSTYAQSRLQKGKKRLIKSDGNLNLANLLGRRTRNKNGRYISSEESSDLPDGVGTGPHPVFKSVIQYYDNLGLDEQGQLDH